MKNTLIALVLLASFGSAASRTPHKVSPVIFVIAVNPDPAIGTILAPDLPSAVQEITDLASLDPVCQAVPQVCEARAQNTTYYVVHKDGTEEIVYGL